MEGTPGVVALSPITDMHRCMLLWYRFSRIRTATVAPITGVPILRIREHNRATLSFVLAAHEIETFSNKFLNRFLIFASEKTVQIIENGADVRSCCPCRVRGTRVHDVVRRTGCA